jgi:hypothetical protein
MSLRKRGLFTDIVPKLERAEKRELGLHLGALAAHLSKVLTLLDTPAVIALVVQTVIDERKKRSDVEKLMYHINHM